ncbi:uncharacterized protein LOC118745656 [Rhagoletis pomonella]|uniref:uncharacterized protein LOC118745656 n=1 Tax=Rhagoletis pomonella TaxID=28610 RepID=UPI001780F84A|nr:uncharacterized protein LOC118745656 [Rhagoletis pomonella]
MFTKQQLEMLVSMMEQNRQFAKGICSKFNAAQKWEEFTQELNCLGPPIPTTTKWIKVWADMKSKTTKKAAQIKAEYRATCGGPNRLQAYTNIEEAIIGLLELDACVNPPGAEFGLDITADDQRLKTCNQ